MYKVDEERVLELLRVMRENIGYIGSVDLKNIKKDKDNIKDYYFVSMALFTLLNKMLELAEEMVDCLDVKRYPTKYIEFFEVLKSEDVIDKNMFSKLKSFVEYRNDIAHEYNEIMEEEIVWCVKNLSYIEYFMRIAKEQLLNKES